MNILITGGAGFIGTHLARRAIIDGHQVNVLDNFSPQIHGDNRELPDDLKSSARLIRGDVRNRATMAAALSGIEAVVHLAAETGTGQSMYEVIRYSDVNISGTATLLDCIINEKHSTISRLVVASSRAIYGEGKYQCADHGVVYPDMRDVEEMKHGQFEPTCPECGEPCTAIPTDEDSALKPSSFYGLTKQMQEQMILMFGKTLDLPAFALRYQNVYGPGQSLKNPYTGILAIFSNLARDSKPINVFEDGLESRDFVYIDDVVEATIRCLNPDLNESGAYNVGSGQKTTVYDVATIINNYFGGNSNIGISGAFRQGDIRHNVADLSRATSHLGFVPSWSFADGINRFLDWAHSQETKGSKIGYEESLAELRRKGLMHG